jgi:probable F420-dependent oxidoreductase
MAYLHDFAAHIEQRGFDSLWVPEHITFFDEITSRYPYTASGVAPVPADPSFPDPFITLAVAATNTERLLLGTAVVILPERHPLITAKQGATVDLMSGGRFVLGVGVGWMREEYEALGVPWHDRGQRCTEYVEAIKVLRTADRSTFKGSTVGFCQAVSYRKPVQAPHAPIYVGGNSAAALRRVAALADGWFGWALSPDDLTATRRRLAGLTEAAGRPAEAVTVQVGLMYRGEPQEIATDVRALWRAGADRVVLSLPFTAVDYRAKVDALAATSSEPTYRVGSWVSLAGSRSRSTTAPRPV